MLSSIEKYLGSINRQKVRLFNEGIDTNQFKPKEIPVKENVLITVLNHFQNTFFA